MPPFVLIPEREQQIDEHENHKEHECRADRQISIKNETDPRWNSGISFVCNFILVAFLICSYKLVWFKVPLGCFLPQSVSLES